MSPKFVTFLFLSIILLFFISNTLRVSAALNVDAFKKSPPQKNIIHQNREGKFEPNSSPKNVSYDKRSIIIDGQRILLLSGSLHYPRTTPVITFPIYFQKSKKIKKKSKNQNRTCGAPS